MRARDVPWDASTTRSQPPGDMAGRNGNMGELKAPYGGLRVRPRRRGSAAEWRARAAGAALLLASLALLRRLHLDGLAPPRLLPPFRPRDLVRESISRTPATSLIESPSWQWGACGGAAAMYPESICGRSYCLRSVAYPGVSIDLFYHAFKQVRDPELLKMCQDPVGGQTGFGARAIEVSYIITYKDQPKRTVQCMLELLRTSREASSVEFVLVNDGSDHDTSVVDAAAKTMTKHFGILVTWVRNTRSAGYGAANNAGVRAARGQYIVLMNNDAFVTPGWLKALLATMRARPWPGIAGPFFANSSGLITEAGGALWANGDAANFGRYYKPDHYHMFRRPVDYISAACIMMERAVFLALGGFKAEYGKGYYEDTDLAMAAYAAGLQVVYQPMSVVVHNEGGSLSKEKEALMARNRETFLSKWRGSLAAENCPREVSLREISTRRAGAYRLLWIDDIVPEPDRDSGSVRALHMALALSSLGFLVDFQGTTVREVRKYESEARALGIHVLPPRGPEQVEFDPEGGRGGGCGYDVVLVSRFYVFQRYSRVIEQKCPGAPVVFDTVDVHFLRDARNAMTGARRWDFNGTSPQHVTAWLAAASEPSNASDPRAAIRARAVDELAHMRRSAATIVVSRAEQQLLRGLLPGTPVHVVSNIHDARVAGRAPEGCAGRRGILFVGNFNHVPNQQAVAALVGDVLPRAADLLTSDEREDFVVHIVGSNRGVEADLGSASLPVEFHGWLSEVELALLYRSVKLVVAPLMSGAGVKGKINQAMLYGVPVVATPIAAEGMHLVHRENCMLADTADAFAAAVVEAYRDCALWERLVRGGYQNIEDHFSVGAATRGLAEVLSQLGFAVPVPPRTYSCSYGAKRPPPPPPAALPPPPPQEQQQQEQEQQQQEQQKEQQQEQQQ